MKVTLEKWAELNLDPPPPLATLRIWARTGRFEPPAVKHGVRYYVEQDARYCEPPPLVRGGSLLSRIERARHGAKAA